MRTLRILRIARLIRIFRIARIVRFIRALQTLVYSIIHTMKSVIWAMLLLFIIIYMFAMILVQAVLDHLMLTDDRHVSEDMMKYWGSLPNAMLTLLETICGGISWDDAALTILETGWLYFLVYLIYILFTVFAGIKNHSPVLNVITGVFCHSAIESAAANHDIIVHEQLQRRHKYVDAVKNVFRDIDQHGSNYITYQELMSHLSDDKARALFAALDIEAEDVWELFKLLDEDESHLIDIQEFSMGCLRLKGNAKAVDLAKFAYDQKQMKQKLYQWMIKMEEALDEFVEKVHKLLLGYELKDKGAERAMV